MSTMNIIGMVIWFVGILLTTQARKWLINDKETKDEIVDRDEQARRDHARWQKELSDEALRNGQR